MKFLFTLIFLISILNLNGCATNKPQNKSIQDLIAAHKDNHKYLNIMNRFISYAKKKNIDQMLSLTGDSFIKKHSLPEVRRIYKTVLIPEINSCKTLKTQKNVTRASKKLTGVGSGLIYNKMCYKKNGKLSLLNIAILNDNSKLSVSSVFIFTANKPNKKIKTVR